MLAALLIGVECVEWPVLIDLNSKRRHALLKTNSLIVGEDEFPGRAQYKLEQRKDTRSEN